MPRETSSPDRNGGQITFTKGSELVVFVHNSTVFMPGFGELKLKEGKDFEFIDSPQSRTRKQTSRISISEQRMK